MDPSFLFQSLKSTFTFKYPFLPFRFQISRSGLKIFDMVCAFFVFIFSPHRLCIASCVFGNLDQLSSSCAFLMFSLLKVTLLEGGRGGLQVFDRIQYDNQYLICNGICFVLKISLLGRSWFWLLFEIFKCSSSHFGPS